MTINKDTKVTIGLLIAILSAVGSYLYAMASLPDKQYVDNKVDTLKDDVKYIREKVDRIQEYLLESK